MEIDRKELKRQARERMGLTDPKFWVVALAYLAMTTGVSWLFSLIPIPRTQTTVIFLQLLLALYTTVVQFGLCLWALWTYRQMDPGLNSLIQGFSVAGRVVVMELGIFARTMGWYFLGATVMGIPMVIVVSASNSYGALAAATVLFTLALIALLTAISLRYALAPYLLADRPDDGPAAAIYRSVTMMRGWKWELFKLNFSFIGYELINLILSGGVMVFFMSQAGLFDPAVVGTMEWANQSMTVLYSVPAVILSTLVTIPVSLWLLPYRMVAQAGFYDARLALMSQAGPSEMPPV